MEPSAQQWAKECGRSAVWRSGDVARRGPSRRTRSRENRPQPTRFDPSIAHQNPWSAGGFCISGCPDRRVECDPLSLRLTCVFGRKRPGDGTQLLTPALVSLIAVATVETAAKQEAAAQRWGIGKSDRWSADLAAGTISFHFGNRVLTGPVQLLGSYSRESETWLWGWANESVPSAVRTASEAVRELGLSDPNLRALSQRKLTGPESFGDDFAATSVEIAQLAGYYRAPSSTGFIYLGLLDFD